MNDPIQYITDATLISKVTQQATGFSLPPFIPIKTTVVVKGSNAIEASAELKYKLQNGLVENTNWIIPLTFDTFSYKDEGNTVTVDKFKLPIDPVISFRSKNIIKRRYVAKKKKRGSIKEYWSLDDWEISITGVIIEEDKTTRENYIRQIRELCSVPCSIPIICELFNEMDIHNIAIEDYDFPFTPGEENQAFSLKCYSDDTYDLLVEK